MADDTDGKPPPPPSAANVPPPAPSETNLPPLLSPEGVAERVAIAGRSFARGWQEAPSKDQPNVTIQEPGSQTYELGEDRRWLRGRQKFAHGVRAESEFDRYRTTKGYSPLGEDIAASERKKQAERDVKRGGKWLTGIPEFAGGMLGDPIGAAGSAMMIGPRAVGGVLRPLERTLERGVRAVTDPIERGMGRVFGMRGHPNVDPHLPGGEFDLAAAQARAQAEARERVGEEYYNRFGYEHDPRVGRGPRTWEQARQTDRSMSAAGRGTWGMQLPPGWRRAVVRGVERVIYTLPGGGRIGRAVEQAQVARSRTVDEIVADLTGRRQTIAPELIDEQIFIAMHYMTPQEQQILRSALEANGRTGAFDVIFNNYIANSRAHPERAMEVLGPMLWGMEHLPANTRREIHRLFAGYAMENMGVRGADGRIGQFTIENFLRNWEGMDDRVHNLIFSQVGLEGGTAAALGTGAGYVNQIRTIVNSITDLRRYADMASAPRESLRAYARDPRTWAGAGEAYAYVHGLYAAFRELDPKPLAYLGTVYGATQGAAYLITNPQATRWVAAQIAKYGLVGAAEKHRQNQARGQQDWLDQLNPNVFPEQSPDLRPPTR